MNWVRTLVRNYWVAIRAILGFTVVLGILYTAVVTGVAALAIPGQANGSLLRDSKGNVVGSALIGQSWQDASGAPLKQWFQGRGSAAGKGYDATSSGGSNLGPENPKLVDAIKAARTAIAKFNGVPESAVPADAVTASGSGLDPDISPEYAKIQVARVAAARGMSAAAVSALVDRNTTPPLLGFIGESTVNVLRLNLDLQNAGG